MFSRRCVGLLLVILLAAGSAFGQGVLGRIVVSVTDSTGAVVVGAKLSLVDQDTGATRTAVSGADGKFVFLNLQNGVYKLTATMQGFKTAVYPDIKLDLGGTAEVPAVLQVGELKTEVVVEAAAEVLQTQTSHIEGGVQGRQLRTLPLNNRDVLDFVLLLPGAQQTGGTRYSTFEALPKGALNITMDGMNVQDNAGKSSSNGGYFTLIRPKQDAVEEISVASGNNAADSAGSGAVQIRFVTRRGTNSWHGGLFEFFRDQGLNANLFFNKRVTDPTKVLPRPANHLHQYGGSIGGPLIKNKLFVFNNFEDFRLPQAFSQSSIIMTDDAMSGIYKYGTGQQVNVLQIAQAAGLPSTTDPTIMAMLNTIRTVRSAAIVPVTIQSVTANSWNDNISWNASSSSRRYFNTTRVDYDINERLRWNVVGQWNHFDSKPDFLNNAGYPYPIEAAKNLVGGQLGRRYSLVTALNWTVTPRLNYEFRLGKVSGISHFSDGIIPLPGGNIFPDGYGFSLSGLGVPTLFSARNSTGYRSIENRDSPIITMYHNFGWVLGKHTFTFGTQLDLIKYWDQYFNYYGLPTISIGVSGSDTAVVSAFSTTAMPGANSSDLSGAYQLWATLVGRVSGVSNGKNVDVRTKSFREGVPYDDLLKQKELGIYFSDSFRAFKTLTLNYGLRFERQGATYDPYGVYTTVGYEGLWGQSGVGNIFKPGTLQGQQPQFNLMTKPLYTAPKGFSPSFGLAWSPNWDNALAKVFLGGPGKSVIRGGYSLATTREGMYVSEGNLYNAPQNGQSAVLRAGTEYLNPNGYTGALMLRDFVSSGQTWPVPYTTFPASYTFPMPVSQFGSTSLYGVDPNLKLAYVQSWSFGIQRELSSSMAIEARYQGNHGTKLWRGINLNEINIFENGFLNEFKLAQNNRAICIASSAACLQAQADRGIAAQYRTTETFYNLGLPGQVPLPILQTALGNSFTRTSLWMSSTWTNYVKYGAAGSMANAIAGNTGRFCNMVRSGVAYCAANGYTGAGAYPANFWQVNPDVFGSSAILLTNAADSFYDAFQVELRRRMAKGLMIQGNYTFSKSISNMYADSTYDMSNFTTVRNTRYDRGVSPYDITHTARVFWTWELPFGPGRHFGTSNKVLSKIAEGWEFSGIAALQSGRAFRLTAGSNTYYTVNQNDPGVILNGVTAKELQQQVMVVKDPARYPTGCAPLTTVYYLNPAMVDPGNSCAAYHYDPTKYADGLLQLPTTPGVWGQRVFLHGPKMIKPDLTLAKQTSITERVNARFEVRFFNAFNITNFMVGSATSTANTLGLTATSFGRTSAYLQDASGNQDPGPRMIELVLRVNF